MTPFQKLTEAVGRTARDLWVRGWAERNAGNMSVRLTADDMDGPALQEGPWQELGVSLPEVAGHRFLFTATGSFFRELALDPEGELGVVEIDDAGCRWRTLWGYRNGRGPTSEILPHLRAHGARMRSGRSVERVLVHTHPTHLIALSYTMPLTTGTLTRLLWEMHTECIVVFPGGCGFIEWRMPGSGEQARATEEVFEDRSLAVWDRHGVVAMGEDLATALGLIETAEKAAEIYLKAAALGPVTRKLDTGQLKALAAKFGVEPDLEILEGKA